MQVAAKCTNGSPRCNASCFGCATLRDAPAKNAWRIRACPRSENPSSRRECVSPNAPTAQSRHYGESTRRAAELKTRCELWHDRCRRSSMARAIWSGSLGFGLVQIPVSLHAVEETDELSLTLLDKRDFSPVGYERINKKTGKEVKWEDTVKGYEAAPG